MVPRTRDSGLNRDVRDPAVLKPAGVTWVVHERRRLVYFAGCDYLRMSWHPEVREAVHRGVDEWGPSVGASRMTTGDVALFGALERDLERAFGEESATLTPTGYAAPMVAVQALAAGHTRILLDERAHACLVDAARGSGLPLARFRHRDPGHLRELLGGAGRGQRALVLTDGMFGADGALAPLAEYVSILPRRAGTLVVDDAHGAAVLGRRGRGTLERCGVEPGRVILTLTLSKGIGCYGGAVLGPRSLARRIRERSPLFTGSTPLPPPMAAGARASLAVLRREGAERRGRLARNLEVLRAGWGEAGLPAEPAAGPVLVVVPKSAAAAARFSGMLRSAGVFPPQIRYPNGPAGGFFRFAVSSEHTPGQIEALRDVVLAFHRPRS